MTTIAMGGLVLERSQAAVSQVDLQCAVEEAEADISEGRVIEHDDMMEQIRRWADE